MTWRNIGGIALLICFLIAVGCMAASVAMDKPELGTIGFCMVVPIALFAWLVKKQRDSDDEARRAKKMEQEAMQEANTAEENKEDGHHE